MNAHRDDVLLLYFSGHGKLDQLGRLHLCMHDTETTDLLSTAVSSMRINEFVEASRASNVVIILDCCYAGAFRGGDFGEAVAGPGRYVMTSCRGTQLANDATVDNGTSFFTQHLVEGLLSAADQDDDGYVRFSDLYAYVDRKLREAGKQIPQRRVNGDGDLPLAKRPRRPAEITAAKERALGPETPFAAQSRGSATAPKTDASVAPADATRRATAGVRSGWPRRRVMIAAATGLVVAGGAAAAVLLLQSGGPGAANSSPGEGSYTATAPWRLRIDGTVYGNGCTVTVTAVDSGTSAQVADNVYGIKRVQIAHTGAFRWRSTDRQCLITPLPGNGTAVLPFTQEDDGDTDAFTAPAKGVTAQITDYKGGTTCQLRLFDAANGQELDTAKAMPGTDRVTLNPNGRTKVYLYDDNCVVRVSAHA
jgi:hypothetical protein